MKLPHPLTMLAWAAIIAAPFAIAAGVIALLPPGIEQVPLHFDLEGNANRYGSPLELYVIAGIMGGANLLMFAMYVFSDALYDHGLVHGVSRRATRPLLLGTGVFLDLVFAFCMISIFAQIQSAL